MPPFVDSCAACAIFLPYFQNTGQSEEYSRKIASWAKTSHLKLRELSEDAETGVSFCKGIELFASVTNVPTSLTSVFPDAVVTVNDRLPPDHRTVVEFETLVADSSRLLPWLIKRLNNKGVEFGNWHVSKEKIVPDLRADIVVNCLGFGSREVFDDQELKAVRGQTILIDRPIGDSAIGGGEFCVYPRGDQTLIGSLWQDGDENILPDDSSYQVLLRTLQSWIRDVLPVLSINDLIDFTPEDCLATVSGLRPVRRQVRLEFDEETNVLHNYGHGGIGYSLAWGCSEDVDKTISSL
jgi:D-amino-acid oxidase